jgi:hypothetical protein
MQIDTELLRMMLDIPPHNLYQFMIYAVCQELLWLAKGHAIHPLANLQITLESSRGCRGKPTITAATHPAWNGEVI